MRPERVLSSVLTAPRTQKSSRPGPISFPKFQIVQKIGDSRYPVFAVYCPEKNEYYAMKMYPYDKDQIPVSFLNETRYLSLSHPNVIHIISSKDHQKTSYGGRTFNASYLLMELASHGDFVQLLEQGLFKADEPLVRTFFHQLVAGIEYLHTNNIAHLDIKLDNLLLGDDFNLKIADFDHSWKQGDTYINGAGTINYRGPGLKNKNCTNPKAADVYSVGIVLFSLKAGALPYLEDRNIEGHDLYDLLKKEDGKFWAIHEKINKDVSFSDDFKKLFLSMVKQNPDERATIEEVKSSPWYNGSTYTEKELVSKVSETLQVDSDDQED